MKELIKDVKLANEVVGTVTITVYETVDELIREVDDAKILACFNSGNKVNIMSNERAKHTTKPLSVAKKFMAGLGVLTVEELQSVAGNEDAMKDLALSDDVQSRLTPPASIAEPIDAGDVVE